MFSYVSSRAHVDALNSSLHIYFLSGWLGTVRLTAHPVLLVAQPVEARNNTVAAQTAWDQTDGAQKMVHPSRSSVCRASANGLGSNGLMLAHLWGRRWFAEIHLRFSVRHSSREGSGAEPRLNSDCRTGWLHGKHFSRASRRYWSHWCKPGRSALGNDQARSAGMEERRMGALSRGGDCRRIPDRRLALSSAHSFLPG